MADRADISLLFDVEGGESVSKGSGARIKWQLGRIIDTINATPFKIKVDVDDESLDKFKRKIQDASSAIEKVGSSKSLGGIDSSLSSISTDLQNVKALLGEISASISSSGSSIKAASENGAAGVQNLAASLNEVLSLVNQINNKDFNISNTFSYSAGAKSTSKNIELYKNEVAGLLEYTNTLNAVMGNISNTAGAYRANFGNFLNRNFTGGVQAFFDTSGKYSGIADRAIEAAGLESVSSVKKILASLTAYKDAYESLINQFSREVPAFRLPDNLNQQLIRTSATFEELHKKVYDAEHQSDKIESVFKSAAEGVASASSKVAKTLPGEDFSVEGYSEKFKSLYTEISSIFDDLRKKIEQTFDLSTLTLDVTKISDTIEALGKRLEDMGVAITNVSKGIETEEERRIREAEKAAKEEQKAAEKAAKAEADAAEKAHREQIKKDNLLAAGRNFSTTLINSKNNWTAPGKQTGYENRDKIASINEELSEYIKQLQNGEISNDEFAESLARLKNQFAELKNTMTGKDEAQHANRKQDDVTRLIRRINSARLALEDMRQRSDLNKDDTDFINNLEEELNKLNPSIKDTTDFLDQLKKKLSEIEGKISNKKTDFEIKDKNVSFLDRMKRLIGNFEPHYMIARLTYAAVRMGKQLAGSVKELDSAMTELKKVTNETDDVYRRFLDNAVTRSKELGSSLTDTVYATADFARLGYSIEEAERLADAAIVYKNVGDGIENIHDASESVIASMQAFGISASDAMLIVDKFNEVGNNFAISSKGIGDALLRSAAAMNAANNTIDETIALATAANTVVQDPMKVGTTMKTMSMYLRASKTEAEEAGESTDGMAESVSKLREELLKLTGGRVDIQSDDSTFKSTYQILKELSQVWGQLSDISQANILERIGGKRNANIIAAIVENFTVAENALNTSMNSAGSALKENEVVLESIEGRINILKAGFEELGKDLIGSDLLKFIVFAGTMIVSATDGMIKFADASGGLIPILLKLLSIFMIFKRGLTIKSTLDLINKFFTSAGSKIKGVFEPLITNLTTAATAWKTYWAARNSGQAQELGAAAMKATGAIAMPAIGLAIGAASIGYSIYERNKARQKEEERAKRDEALSAADNARIEAREVSSLMGEYQGLLAQYHAGKNVREDLLRVEGQIVSKYHLQKEAIDDAADSMERYNKVAMEKASDELKDSLISQGQGINTEKQDIMDGISEMMSEYNFGVGGIRVTLGELTNASGKINDEIVDTLNLLGDIKDASGNAIFSIKEVFNSVATGVPIETSGEYSKENPSKIIEDIKKSSKFFDGYQIEPIGKFDIENVDDAINVYKELWSIITQLSDAGYDNSIVYSELFEQYNSLGNVIGDYTDHINEYNNTLLNKVLIDQLIKDGVPETEDAFDSFKKSMIAAAEGTENWIDNGVDIAVILDQILSKEPAFAKFYADMISPPEPTIESMFGGLLKQLDEFIDKASKIKSVQDAIANGFEMPIKKALELAKIYPEILNGATISANGQIKLSKDVVSAVIEHKKAELNAEIDAQIQELEAQKVGVIAKINNMKTFAQNNGIITSAMASMFDQAAIAASTSVHDSTENMKGNVASFGQQVQQVLQSIADGDETVDTSIVQGVGVYGGGGISLDLSSATTMGPGHRPFTEVNLSSGAGNVEPGFTQGFLDGFMSMLGDLVDNVSGIDAQIGILEGLRDTGFEGLDDLTGSTSGGGGGGGGSSELDNWFQKEYALHNNLVAIDKEEVRDYLEWLDDAYKRAYDEKLITLDDYYKYQEEVYTGLQDLFKDYLNDQEHEISMRESHDGELHNILGIYEKLIVDVEEEIKKARARGLDDNDDYIQELQGQWVNYHNAIKDLREKTESEARSAVDSLINIRINMLKQDIKNEQDAIKEKLDALKDFYDEQKKLLRDARDEEKYLEEQSEKRRSVIRIQEELERIRNDNSAWAEKKRLELKEQLKEEEKNLDNFEKDHALEKVEEQLDAEYEKQKEALDKQNDLLEEKLNNAKGLYDQALNDIRNGSTELYNEMILWNQKYGDGIDETITDAWESAYISLQKYYDLFKEYYKDIKLGNATGYEGDMGKWEDSKISGGKDDESSKKPENKPSNKPSAPDASNQAPPPPSLNKGSSIVVKSSATRFSARSGNQYMASFVPGGSYTVYDAIGNEILIGRNGHYTGWINKEDIVGYASGTHSASPGIHRIDENGSELIFHSSNGDKYKLFTGGEKVLPADASNFLFDFATHGKEIFKKLLGGTSSSYLDQLRSGVSQSNHVKMGDIIISGSATAQTVSEIRRAQRDGLSDMLTALNRLNK